MEAAHDRRHQRNDVVYVHVHDLRGPIHRRDFFLVGPRRRRQQPPRTSASCNGAGPLAVAVDVLCPKPVAGFSMAVLVGCVPSLSFRSTGSRVFCVLLAPIPSCFFGIGRRPRLCLEIVAGATDRPQTVFRFSVAPEVRGRKCFLTTAAKFFRKCCNRRNIILWNSKKFGPRVPRYGLRRAEFRPPPPGAPRHRAGANHRRKGPRKPLATWRLIAYQGNACSQRQAMSHILCMRLVPGCAQVARRAVSPRLEHLLNRSHR